MLSHRSVGQQTTRGLHSLTSTLFPAMSGSMCFRQRPWRPPHSTTSLNAAMKDCQLFLLVTTSLLMSVSSRMAVWPLPLGRQWPQCEIGFQIHRLACRGHLGIGHEED